MIKASLLFAAAAAALAVSPATARPMTAAVRSAANFSPVRV